MRHPKMKIVAYHATVTMHQASWGDEAGSTVTFKLPMKEAEGSRNPFQSFTKRRKGTAGTRFFMAVQTIEPKPQPVYEDEAMLAGWNDSQQNGHTVKLWLCNDAMGHPFDGIGRKQELMIVLSELEDDNSPVDQKMRDRVEAQVDTGKQRTSNVAALFCRTGPFWLWIETTDYLDGIVTQDVADELTAKHWMYQVLGITSRAELDSDNMLATQFERKIRGPYQKWYETKYGNPF